MESREAVLSQVRKLAKSRVNDAVRLAFLTGEELDKLDGLDLSAVTEFKRNKDGGVELKFVDRLSALQWLMEQTRQSGDQKFFGACEQAARVWEENGG